MLQLAKMPIADDCKLFGTESAFDFNDFCFLPLFLCVAGVCVAGVCVGGVCGGGEGGRVEVMETPMVS